jgi:PAS domain S-box-containing protein
MPPEAIEADLEFFDRSPEGIVRFRADGLQTITYVNPKAAAILGARPDALKGRSIWDLVPDEPNRAVIREQFEHRLRGDSGEYEVEITRLDDRRKVPVCIVAIPLRDSSGKTVGGHTSPSATCRSSGRSRRCTTPSRRSANPTCYSTRRDGSSPGSSPSTSSSCRC